MFAREVEQTLVQVRVQMLDAPSIEGGRAPNDPMDLVAFLEMELGEIRSILSSDS